VESCLKSLMMAFCCDNHRDERHLQALTMRYLKDKRPTIIVSQFSDAPYNITQRSVLAHIHTHTHTHAHIHTHTNPNVHIHTQTDTHQHVHSCSYNHISTFTHRDVHITTYRNAFYHNTNTHICRGT